MNPPVIDIGAFGEAGLFVAGISFGVALMFKIIKWAKEMFAAPKSQSTQLPPINGANGKRFMTVEEHSTICKQSEKRTEDGFSRLERAMEKANLARVSEVTRLFDKIDSNHDVVINRFQQQGERIASLEAKVS